jgi:quercetin dioxygenase-like cupin family protein
MSGATSTLGVLTSAVITQANAGVRHDIMGTDVEVKLTGAMTGGALSLFDMRAFPGQGVPPHLHRREDEIFHVTEGELRFVCAGVTQIGGPGTTVFLPRNVPHEWWVHGDKPARCVLLTTPGGFDQFFVEFQTPRDGKPLPPEQAVAVARKYGIEFV